MMEFVVYGCAVPQGSSRAFVPKGWTRPVITTDNAKLKPWRQQVSGAAAEAMQKAGLAMLTRDVPARVEVVFYFQKPASWSKNRNHKTTKPDCDKLLRGLLDSLTGIVFEDDSQVTSCSVVKAFGQPECAVVRVERVEVPPPQPVPDKSLFDYGRPVSRLLDSPKEEEML